MRSLSLKMILAFMAVSILGVLILSILVIQVTNNQFDRFLLDEAQGSLVTELSSYYNEHQTWDGLEDIFNMPARNPMGGSHGSQFGRPLEGRYQNAFILLSPDNTIIFPEKGIDSIASIPAERLENATSIKSDGEVVGKLLVLGDNLRNFESAINFVSQFTQGIYFAAGGSLLAAILLGVLLARNLTRPIQEMSAATRAVAAGDLSQQIEVHSQDELGELAASFNTMTSQLAQSQNKRRQMTADIAHELRTPLSIILGHAEGVKDGVFEPSRETFDVILDEAERLDNLVEDLRTLSLSETGEMQFSMRPINVSDYLQRSAATYQVLAANKNINLRIEAPSVDLFAEMDPDRMSQVMGNLIGNAVRHTPAGGEILLRAQRNADRVEIQVRDSGSGIPAAEIEHVFQRFYRVDKARNREDGGSGLGLAITKSLVQNQNGTISVQSSAGAGTTFTISLPVVENGIARD